MSSRKRDVQREKEDNSNSPQDSKRKRATVIDRSMLLELPVNRIRDILSWLPVDTIFSCKCVCKTFLDILRDPNFATLHLARSSDIDYRLIIPEKVQPFNICLLPILDLERSAPQSRWQTLATPSTLSQPTIDISLIGSDNGLVCIQYLSRDVIDICVCNPILGEFMILPQPWPCGAGIRFGFGFCPSTKQYKVIRFQFGLSCEIYTLGTNEWRRIVNAQCPKFLSTSMDSSLNGILHCVVGLNASTIRNKLAIRYEICSLNLETEQFSHISLPAIIPKTISRPKTGILDGLLCLYYVSERNHLEICAMKQYGVEESWTKTLKIRIEFDHHEPLGIFEVKILNYRDLVFRYNNYKSLFHYNSLLGMVRKLNVPKPFEATGYDPDVSEAIVHVPSLVSLKHIAGEENVELVRRTKISINNLADSTSSCDKFIIT